MEERREHCEVRGAWCQMCGPGRSNCYTRCFLEDGKWIGVEGCPNAANDGAFGTTSLCAKGQAAPASLSSSPRLTHPLRRVGPKGPDAKFERISWDEAFGHIAKTLLAQKQAYGAESFGILSPQFFPVLAGLGRRFLNVHGSPNYLHSGICHVQRTVSTATVLGPGSGMPGGETSTAPKQLGKTELLVRWGANPENSAVNMGGLCGQLEAAQRGMKVVDIRPLCDPLAAKADIWLPVRPGTDLALALGFLHVICGEELYDHDFVRDWCQGFGELATHVRAFTPEWAQERCGIPAERIVEVARMIAKAKPCGIVMGNGVGDQSRDGHWTVVAIQLIGAICGNVGKPGGGADGAPLPPLVRFRPFCDTLRDRMPASEEDKANGWVPGTSKLVAPEFPRWATAMAHSGEPTSSYLRGLESVLTGEPYPLRTLFAQATNPLSQTRDPKLVARALEAIDFYVAMDLWWNPSCDYADIVLPAASPYECSEQIGVRNFAEGAFIGMNQKLADPPGEAMSDTEFYLQLAVRMGYGADFWDGDVEAYLDELAAPTGFTVEQLRGAPDGIFVPRFQDDGGTGAITDDDRLVGRSQRAASAVQAGKVAESCTVQPDYARLFAALPGGKVQCRNDVVGGKVGNDSRTVLPAFPEYRGPAEGIAETPELAREYPYAFSDVHAHRLSQHSYYGDIAELRAFAPEPWVKMHPTTAARHGILDGDWVDVESPHGHCVLQASLTEGVAPDVLMGRRGWWQACPGLDISGYAWTDGGAEVNVLYSGDAAHSDPFHTAHGKQTLVRIRKHEGCGPLPYAPSSTDGVTKPAADSREERRGDGAVAAAVRGRFSFDAQLCTKCHACEVACAMWHEDGPFRIVEECEAGAFPVVGRTFTSRPLSGCDLCATAGGSPRCAGACPTGALQFREQSL